MKYFENPLMIPVTMVVGVVAFFLLAVLVLGR